MSQKEKQSFTCFAMLMAAAMQMPAADAYKDSQPGLIFITYLCLDVLLEAWTFLPLSSREQDASKVRAHSALYMALKEKEKMKTRCVSLPMANTRLSILTVLLTSAATETTSHSALPCLAEVAALSIASL